MAKSSKAKKSTPIAKKKPPAAAAAARNRNPLTSTPQEVAQELSAPAGDEAPAADLQQDSDIALPTNEELDRAQGLLPLPPMPAPDAQLDFASVDGADELLAMAAEYMDLNQAVDTLVHTETPRPDHLAPDKEWNRLEELKLNMLSILQGTGSRAIRCLDWNVVWNRGTNSTISQQKLCDVGVGLATIKRAKVLKRYDYVTVKPVKKQSEQLGGVLGPDYLPGEPE